MDLIELKKELKRIVIVESDNEDDFSPEDISDEQALIGDDSTLCLDSLDILQISMALKKRYGVRIEGVKDGRLAFASINALADYIQQAMREDE
jgi:acyl carrier protein